MTRRRTGKQWWQNDDEEKRVALIQKAKEVAGKQGVSIASVRRVGYSTFSEHNGASHVTHADQWEWFDGKEWKLVTYERGGPSPAFATGWSPSKS